jgi:NTP pyrophosphatase (non-canonical NTP hydrolase)
METIKTINLNKLRDEAYQNAVEHGWHDEDLSDEHFLCLVISELMEAVQAERKGKRSDVAKFNEWQGNNIPFSEETRVRRFQEDFEAYIKDSVEDELADVCIRIFDLAGLLGVSFLGVKFPLKIREEIYKYKSQKTFTEWCYDLTRFIANYNPWHITTLDFFVNILQEVFIMSKIKGFDFLWHIEQKMKYNRTRPRMHGNNKF